MSARINIFATEEDILALAREIKPAGPLQIVRAGRSRATKPIVLDSISLLKNLGKADADATISCTAYLILPQGSPINFRDLGGLPLTDRYSYDQLANPDSVLFSPGGLRDQNTMLAGMIGTASSTTGSKEIMRLMDKAVKKLFSKRGAFWIGPQAAEYLQQGVRLTTNIRSPREYDLK